MLVRSDSICWVVPLDSSRAAGNATLYVLGGRLPGRVVVIDLFVSAFGAGERWTLHEQSAVAV
jgi:hypothetical protein